MVVVLWIGGLRAAARQAEIIASVDESLQPDFLRRDLAVMQRELKLDAGQSAIVQSLFEEYQTRFRAAAEQVRQETIRLRPAVGVGDPNLEQQREEIRQRVAALVEEAQRVREESPDADVQELQRQFHERAERLREELRQLHAPVLTDDDARRVVEQSLDRLERWESEKADLPRRFVAEALRGLGEEQRQAWPALERQLMREKSLPRGRLAGESIDLIALTRELHLSDEQVASLKPVLEQYAMRLNDALRARDEFFRSVRRQLFQSIQTGDQSQIAAIIERHVQTRVAVRAVNDEFARVIAAALDPAAGEQFGQTWKSRGYSRVYRTTHAQRVINAARELYGDAPELSQMLENLARGYQAEVSAINERLLRLVQIHEPHELREVTLRQWGFDIEDADRTKGGPLAREFQARDEVGKRYLRQLEALLTPEQYQTAGGTAGGS